MPVYETDVVVSCTPEKAFDFLVRPANLLLGLPAGLSVEADRRAERLLSARALLFKVASSAFRRRSPTK